MSINWKRALLAGLLGTVIFDVVGLLLTGQWWDIPALLGTKLGTGLVGGLVGHYGNGVLLAIIYAAIGPALWGPGWVRALTYITIETVFGVWLFFLPLVGAGIAGLGLGALIPVIVLLRHWGYAAALAWLYPLPRSAPSDQPVRSPVA